MSEVGVLYRAVGGREVRIAAAEGGVDLEPLDAETEAVARKLLGFEFDLLGFYAWAAGEERIAPLVVRFAGFRPTLSPDPFEMLVGAIAAQQVSLFAALAIRNRLVERFGEQVGRVWAFPARERVAPFPRQTRVCSALNKAQSKRFITHKEPRDHERRFEIPIAVDAA